MIVIIITLVAIIITITYSLCKVASEADRIEEQESVDWAIKWNEQREKKE